MGLRQNVPDVSVRKRFLDVEIDLTKAMGLRRWLDPESQGTELKSVEIDLTKAMGLRLLLAVAVKLLEH